MRPEILNPLFAALTDLQGVGPQLAKPLTRLGLERVVDVLFHLPTGPISRIPVDRLDQAQAGQTLLLDVPAPDYRPGRSPPAPTGVAAVNRKGVCEGQRVSGRVDFRGHRVLNKKNKKS